MNARTHFPVLDSLRAVASVSVVATHCAFQTGFYSHGFWGAITARLDVGVALFFVLSGFLLSRPYLAAIHDAAPLPSTLSYFWKRALRILPTYWIGVVAALLVVPENRGASLGTWLSNLAMTTVYGTEEYPRGLAQMWSLAVEVSFYLVLPVLAVCAARLVCRRWWDPAMLLTWLGAAVILSVAWVGGFANALAPDRLFAPQWLPGHLAWFAAGIALAVASFEREKDPKALILIRRLGKTPWTCLAMASALLVIATTPIAGPVGLESSTSTQAVVKLLLYGLVATLVVLPGAYTPRDSAFVRVWSVRWLRHLGNLSYALFCLHMIVLLVVFDVLGWSLFSGGGLALFGITLAITLPLCELLYRVVELPAHRLRHLVGGSKNSAAKAPSVTSTAN